MRNHYNQKYFSWQKKAGEYGGQQDLWKFKPFIKQSDFVLDFGCGGGYILEKLDCKEKYGIEINETAIKETRRRGISVFKKLSDLPSSVKFDVIISHHTLEHLENPAEILKEMKKYLKKSGVAVHVVPINDWRSEKKYAKNDINKHLYTWTPQLLGNLFTQCGYEVKEISITPYQWLPLSRYYFKYIPKFLYYPLGKFWGALLKIREMRIIATLT